jgi:hypothetical protein
MKLLPLMVPVMCWVKERRLAGRTWSVYLAMEVPKLLVAVMVYSTGACAAVGRPLRDPVWVSNVVPAGAAGEMLKEEIDPPLYVAAKPLIPLLT